MTERGTTVSWTAAAAGPGMRWLGWWWEGCGGLSCWGWDWEAVAPKEWGRGSKRMSESSRSSASSQPAVSSFPAATLAAAGSGSCAIEREGEEAATGDAGGASEVS